MTNEECEQQRASILTLLRGSEGLTLSALSQETGLDVKTLERRLRILRNRRKIDEIAGVWFATTEEG